jgi:hypothetical protein
MFEQHWPFDWHVWPFAEQAGAEEETGAGAACRELLARVTAAADDEGDPADVFEDAEEKTMAAALELPGFDELEEETAGGAVLEEACDELCRNDEEILEDAGMADDADEDWGALLEELGH